MRGTIDDILKQKYDEVKVPEGLINFRELVENVEMPGAKKRKKKKRIIIASLILVILLCGATILGIILTADKPENVTPSSYVAEININRKVFSIDSDPPEEKIYSIKIEQIEEYSTFNDENVKYPITKVKAQVLNYFSGDEREYVEFWIPGGVFTVRELKESGLEYDKVYISGFEDEEKIMVNYFERNRIDKPQVGNTYVVTLVDIDNELYVNKSLELGFKKYNEETNQFLNDFGEWVELDLNK